MDGLDRCKYCLSERRWQVLGKGVEYRCGTMYHWAGVNEQHAGCRIKQLEQENEMYRATIDAAMKRLESPGD